MNRSKDFMADTWYAFRDAQLWWELVPTRENKIARERARKALLKAWGADA